jgi:hypothetical protein
VRGRLVWGAVWLVVAAAVVLPHLQAFSMLSKIDEYQHVDYLAKTMALDHVQGGELVGQTAMREQACRGIDLEGFVLPRCHSRVFDPDEFPGHGFNHTYSDPPTYYAATGVVAKVVEVATGAGLVTAGRAVGVLWLALGLVVTFGLCRRLGASTPASAGATLLVAATPTVVASVTTITTDAPLVAVGGLLLLTAVNVAEEKWRWWWLAPAALLAMGVKSTALPAVGVAILFLLFHRKVRAGVAAALGALLPTLTWGVYTSATTLPAADDIPMGRIFEVDSIGLTQIAGSLRTTFSPVVVPERAPFLHTLPVDGAVQVLNVLLVVGVFAVAWFWPWATTEGRFGVATAAGMLVYGPAFVVLLFLQLGVSYIIPGRYGLSILPAAAACLALVASRRRAGDVALPVLGAGGLALLLAYTLTS